MTNALHFGTDEWRAIIGEDCTEDNLARVIEASAKVFKEEVLATCGGRELAAAHGTRC